MVQTMATASPLLLTEDVDFFAADDAYVATLPPDVRAAIESAEERIAAGTAQLVPHAEVTRALEEQRVAARAAGDRSATRR
jgi:hypothetical protein